MNVIGIVFLSILVYLVIGFCVWRMCIYLPRRICKIDKSWPDEWHMSISIFWPLTLIGLGIALISDTSWPFERR